MRRASLRFTAYIALFPLILLPSLPLPAQQEEVSPLRRSLETLDLPRRIEEAFLRIPRGFFLPEQLGSFSNDDQAIPLGEDTIVPDFSATASLLQELELEETSRLLVYGRGCGFFAGLAATLAAEVIVVERNGEEARKYPQLWEELALENIRLVEADELKEERSFDAILIHAGSTRLPSTFISLLSYGGRLIIPLTDESGNQVLSILYRSDEGIELRSAAEVYFPPADELFPQLP